MHYHYDFLMSLSFVRWGVEALYSEVLSPFRGLYQVDAISAPATGYTLDRVSVDFFLMFLLGTLLRALCYVVLVTFNRHKQL